MLKLIGWAWIFCLLLPASAWAQAYRVAAIVTIQSISNYDLQERVLMIARSSSLPDTEEARQKIIAGALQGLINEALYQQKAEELGVEVKEADMRLAMQDLEARNNLEEGGFPDYIKSQGIPEHTMMQQLRGQILWQKIMGREVRSRVQVSDYEIQDALDQLKHADSVTEVYLSEIFLAAETEEQQKEARELAHHIYTQLQGGARFSEIAQQFSTANTRQKGGVIGWMPQNQLRGALREVVERTEENQVTGPIPSEQGFHILKVGNRRTLEKNMSTAKMRTLLQRQKTEQEARRYIKELRAAAFIEIRL